MTDLAAVEQSEISTDVDATAVDDRSTPAWRQFEQDVVATLNNLDPAAVIRHDQKVLGDSSQVMRQLDATAQKTVVGARVDFVIECKQYNRPLGIGKIDEFIGKLIDVGCSYGILYATSGVTDPARKRAENARNPRVLLRDLSDVSAFANASPRSKTEIDQYVEEHAFDFSDLVEEAVFGNCQADNCWYGEVMLEDFDGIQAGHCGSCGQLHVKCGCCDEFSEIDYSSDSSCFVCGATYSVISYKGDFDGIEQITHGEDCDERHDSAKLEHPGSSVEKFELVGAELMLDDE